MNKLFPLFFLFFAPQVQAACLEPLRSGIEAYRCILEQSPNIQALKFRTEEFQALSAKAKQIPNPELDAGLQFTGEKKTEISLLQPVEIGGKRSARAEKVQAEISLLSARDLESRIEASNAALDSLIRLRQLKSESEFTKDSLSLLGRINSKLKTRAALSPEQATTLRLFSTFEKTLRFRRVF